MLFGETKLGKFGETISEKVLETAVFRQKAGKNDDFLRSQFASDSVIRWFESSYPSQLYRGGLELDPLERALELGEHRAVL